MNNKYLAILLIASTCVLASCKDSDKGGYTDMGQNDGVGLPGQVDQVPVGGGIAEPARGDFDPNKVDYQTLADYTVHFDFDKSTVLAQDRPKLEQVAKWFKDNPGHMLFLAGHTDKRGTPEYNRALGERRALSVREYLAGLGIPAATLYTNSYGADRPASQGDTEADFAQNRRVEIGVIQK